MKFGDAVILIIVITVVLLIIIPLSPFVLDLLLVINLALSLIILLTTLSTKEPLEFSIFPSLLLIMTLYRLALNISSTRLILGNGGEAGNVIKTFGSFVIRGNIVVGFIIFVIIIIIQFVVITKGAERVAEVAARFTLDAMPGKQMAIDADMNSGLINEVQARERRQKIQREADFYGAMDGSSKFVKGDAIVGIIITVVNVVGGIIIGFTSATPMPWQKVIQIYTLASVGDGLVSQFPALLISAATGIIVTRAASEENIGKDLSNQLLSNPLVLIITGVVLIGLSLIPGLPKIYLWMFAAVLLVRGFNSINRDSISEIEEEDRIIEQQAEEAKKPENVMELLQVDPIELEFGYAIIPLADTKQGGDLLDRVVMLRRQCALELGMIVPIIRLRDNIQIGANEYIIKIRGAETARGEVMPDRFLAMNPDDFGQDIEGINTVEPTFGLPAKWIAKSKREQAELNGYTIVDPPSVIITHLTEVIKRHAHELLGRQEVQAIIENIRQTHPVLIEEIVPKLLSIGDVQKVLANLLREGISIRDMITILETLCDYSQISKDTDMLTEYVRQGLKRIISKKFFIDNCADVITIDPTLEQFILDNVRQTELGSYLSIEPEKIRSILKSLSEQITLLSNKGVQPILLSSPGVRTYIKKLSEQLMPELIVVSYSEIEQSVEINSLGVVSI